MKVWLVRHAMPEVDPDTDPAGWPLSAAGRVAARSLVRRLPAHPALWASDEPKAAQTLEPAGPVTRDRDLGEVRRHEPFDEGFRRRRAAYVAGATHAGWEPQAAVASRFDAAVRRALDAAAGHPLVVASHGMAITSWLLLRGVVAEADARAFWAALDFPDLLEIDLEVRRWTRV